MKAKSKTKPDAANGDDKWRERFAKNLIKARKHRGLSQLQVGTATGLGAPTINHFEHGRRAPNVGNLLKLCRALRASSDKLIGRCD